MNINDEKDLRPGPKTHHPINTNTTPRQLSPFNDQLADFREPPAPLSGRNSLTDHKKTYDVPLVIEQTLMRSVETTGGPTRGRGITQIQRLVWLLSMPFTAEVNSSMQCLTGNLRFICLLR